MWLVWCKKNWWIVVEVVGVEGGKVWFDFVGVSGVVVLLIGYECNLFLCFFIGWL